MAELSKRMSGRNTATVRRVTRAYADEWFAHYNYTYVVNTLSGPDSSALIAAIEPRSCRALARANRWAARLRQLGAAIPAKLIDLMDLATNKPFKLPKNVRDTDGMLRAVLDAERTSIRTYQALLDHVRGNDLVTEKWVVEFLGEAMEGEEELERLLGRPAPDATGR